MQPAAGSANFPGLLPHQDGGLAHGRCSMNPWKRNVSSHFSLPFLLRALRPQGSEVRKTAPHPPPPGSPWYSLGNKLMPSLETGLVWRVMGGDGTVGAWRGRRGPPEGQVAVGAQGTPGSAGAGLEGVPGVGSARRPAEGRRGVRRGPVRARGRGTGSGTGLTSGPQQQQHQQQQHNGRGSAALRARPAGPRPALTLHRE